MTCWSGHSELHYFAIHFPTEGSSNMIWNAVTWEMGPKVRVTEKIFKFIHALWHAVYKIIQVTDHSSSVLVKFSSKCVLDLRFQNCLVLPKILLEGTDWQVTQDAATHICSGVALNLERNFLNFHTSQFRVPNLDFVAKIPGSEVVSLSSNLDSTDKWFGEKLVMSWAWKNSFTV